MSFHSNKAKLGCIAGVAIVGMAAFFHTPTEWDAVRSRSQVARAPIDPRSSLAQTAGRVFYGQSCSGCHFVKGVWCYHGISLEHAAEKYDPTTLRRLIRNPKSVRPQFHMPAQDKVTDAEIEAMVDFLVSLPHSQTSSISILEHH